MDWINYNKTYRYAHIDTTARLWGWDVRMVIDDGMGTSGELLFFSRQPTQEQIEEAMLRRMSQYGEPPPEPEKVYTETEIVELLVSKELLNEGQKLDDLKSRYEMEARNG
jgi:hypothetical protein